MIKEFLPEKIKYTGEQLNGLFAYQKIRATDDSIIAFVGETNVKEHLVDFEDKLANDFIYSKEMLHLIVSIHGNDLCRARLWQLLLVQKAFDLLDITNKKKEGDDIYIIEENKKFKLSVSIAALSTNQKEMIHLGLNINDGGAPVPTSSLTKLGIDPYRFGAELISNFKDEYDSIKKTMYKVCSTN